MCCVNPAITDYTLWFMPQCSVWIQHAPFAIRWSLNFCYFQLKGSQSSAKKDCSWVSTTMHHNALSIHIKLCFLSFIRSAIDLLCACKHTDVHTPPLITHGTQVPPFTQQVLEILLQNHFVLVPPTALHTTPVIVHACPGPHPPSLAASGTAHIYLFILIA